MNAKVVFFYLFLAGHLFIHSSIFKRVESVLLLVSGRENKDVLSKVVAPSTKEAFQIFLLAPTLMYAGTLEVGLFACVV